MDFEITKPDNHENLFFHQQRNPVRQYRRVRKEPEELPQALRYFKYANLNPRIAAFLGKQDPKSLLKRAKTQGGKPDGKESAAVAPTGSDLSRDVRGLLPDIGAGFGKMTTFGDDGFAQSRLSMYNENEDPQRYQFEETTFAAPNILRELADTLQRFTSSFKEYIQRTTLYDPETGDSLAAEIASPSALLPKGIKELVCETWEDVTANVIYVPRTWQSIQAGLKYEMSLASGKADNSLTATNAAHKLPEGTSDKKGGTTVGLKSIVDLLEEVQSKSHSKREGETSDTKTHKKGKSTPKDATSLLPGVKKKPKIEMSRRGSKEKNRNYATVVGELFEKDDKTGMIKGVDYSQLFTAVSISPRAYRDKLDKPPVPISGHEKDKIQKYQQYRMKNKAYDGRVSIHITHSPIKRLNPADLFGAGKVKDWSMKSAASFHNHEEKEKAHRYGTNPTISFNLSSKKAFDEGWVVNVQPEPDMNENNLLEWATSKLQMAMKQREDEDDEARKMGYDKPVQIRYYGDSRRDTLLKLYRKGNETEGRISAMPSALFPGNKKPGAVPKIPQLRKFDDSQRERFTVQLPDGSTSVYYAKSGELAIMASAVPNAPGQLYVHCYGNDADRTCLATFTPYGKSCCYHKNGVPGLILTEKGGLVKSENGTVMRKWTWPSEDAKPKDPVTFVLNKEMFVRIINQHNVILNFTSNRESIKLQVGAVRGTLAPSGLTSSQSIVLQSSYSLSLQAAQDFGHANRVAEKPTKPQPKQRKGPPYFRKLTMTRKPTDLEILKHALDPPERFEYDSQADRELLRLKDKSKHLLEDWMEHYRVVLGISSPALKKLYDRPQVKTAQRKVQSAKERKITYAEEDEFEDKDKYQSFRSPSAPPRHMLPGPHSLTVKDTRTKPTTATAAASKKATETPTVRIESPKLSEHYIGDQHTMIVTAPSSSRTHIASQMSHKQRPSTHGAKSGRLTQQRPSGIRTSNSAHSCTTSHPQSRERTSSSPECDCCPVVTRHKLLNTDEKKESEKMNFCKCSKHRIPLIFDLELDYFLHMVAPVSQLIVIFVVNSLYPNANPCEKMLDDMYIVRNKNRTQPCRQSRHDAYRVLRYDLAVAKSSTHRSTPLLLGRHNAVPGMALMYCGGRLVFADHIFNGYGNAKNDFRKQVMKSRQEYMSGHFLPDDFRFTPGRGKSGFRAAWGGEMGGAGIDGKGQPGMFFTSSNQLPRSERKSLSAVNLPYSTNSDSELTSSSSFIRSAGVPAFKSFDTARDFIQYSLSTHVYSQTKSRRLSKNVTPVNHSADKTNRKTSYLPATPQSAESSLRMDRMSGFLRMQAVK